KYIKSFCSTSYQYYVLVDKVIKMKQRLTKGFPRPDGKCKYYSSSNIIKVNTDIEFKDYNKELHRCMDENINNLDLVRGDIVDFGPDHNFAQPYQAIYNGDMLEEMEYDTGGEGDLPENYQIIKNDVPIDYWYQQSCWCN